MIWLLTLSMIALLGAFAVSAFVLAHLRRSAQPKPVEPAPVADPELEETVRYAVTLLRLGSASRALHALEDALP